MQKELPKPAIYGSLVVVVAVLGFFLFRALSGPGEIPRTKPLYYDPAKPLPDYLMKSLPPDQRDRIIQQIKATGIPKPGAANSAPTAQSGPPGR